jgi:hypothetical protein
MKNLTPRDITQLIFGITVAILLFYLLVPRGTKIRKKIDAQQQYIEVLQQRDRDRVVADSIHRIYYEQRINELDSIILVGDRKSKEQETQIRLLWLNNYELRKNYDSLRNTVPVLPDF